MKVGEELTLYSVYQIRETFSNSLLACFLNLRNLPFMQMKKKIVLRIFCVYVSQLPNNIIKYTPKNFPHSHACSDYKNSWFHQFQTCRDSYTELFIQPFVSRRYSPSPPHTLIISLDAGRVVVFLRPDTNCSLLTCNLG